MIKQATLKILILMISVLISLSIAILTRFNAHNDEARHFDSFAYFEGKWWPPDLGSDTVKYSKHGISRVYSGEVVYILYGNLSHFFKQILDIKSSYYIYRIFNVFLFSVTLYALLFSKARGINTSGIGLVFVCIPQIYRIYSYANSDAWALSLSVFIFLLALKNYSTPLFNWRIKDILLFGIFTGLILVSKKNFLISLILPYSLIAYSTSRLSNIKGEKMIYKYVKTLILLVIPAFLITSPLKVFYPISQGDYKKLKMAAKEKYSAEGFKPSNPYDPTIRLKEKGFTYLELLKERPWIRQTAISFWGYYGLRNPQWIYFIVFSAGFLLLGLTFFELKTVDPDFRFYLFIGLIVIGINIIASLYYSLYIDYEPQGRFLYPSLISISIWMMGRSNVHFSIIKKMRIIAFCTIYPLCLYSLMFIFIPKLSRF